jgi:hypothetical protein
MANPTTNYSFSMPTNTDLVKDLPADFEVFGQAVDTQMKTNADAAIAKTIVDAKGDLIAATAADTVSRLAVGTNGQVLTADSAEATGLKWAAAAGGASYTLLNTGGTSLTGASTTVSSLSAENFLIIISGASGSDDMTMSMRINGDTGSNYVYAGFILNLENQGSDVTFPLTSTSATSLPMVKTAGGSGVSNLGMWIDGGKSTGFKSFDLISSANNPGAGTNLRTNALKGIYKASAAITSFTFIASGVNFDAGTVFIYGSN